MCLSQPFTACRQSFQKKKGGKKAQPACVSPSLAGHHAAGEGQQQARCCSAAWHATARGTLGWQGPRGAVGRARTAHQVHSCSARRSAAHGRSRRSRACTAAPARSTALAAGAHLVPALAHEGEVVVQAAQRAARQLLSGGDLGSLGLLGHHRHDLRQASRSGRPREAAVGVLQGGCSSAAALHRSSPDAGGARCAVVRALCASASRRRGEASWHDVSPRQAGKAWEGGSAYGGTRSSDAASPAPSALNAP